MVVVHVTVVVLVVVVIIVVVGATGNVKLKLLHKFVRQQVDWKTALFNGKQKWLHPAWNFSGPNPGFNLKVYGFNLKIINWFINW